MNRIKKQIEKIIELFRVMVNPVITWMNGIAKDKYQHYSLGVSIASAFFLVTTPVSFIFLSASTSILFSLAVSIVVVIAAAIWKDYTYDQKADKNDIRITILGGATVWIAILLTLILR